MPPSRRAVVFDPGLSAAVGHHADVNSLVLAGLRQAGWDAELWADRAAGSHELASLLPGVRPVLEGAGYIDPRHWCDLAGSLHQASRLRPQLAEAVRGEPVAVWVAHSLLPFQLIALAQLLQQQPPAQVLISLMFGPGELLGGQPDHDLQAQRQAAELNTRTALAALAQAVARAGHRLTLGSGCSQLIERLAPLCASAGLPSPQLHPAVVLADPPSATAATASLGGAQVLLHWGERKADKGRELGVAVLEHLLRADALPPPLRDCQWCFHAAGTKPDAPEAARLQQAAGHPQITVLEGHQGRDRMLAALGRTSLALLPYCPVAYAERSSGVLWLYGASRLALGQPARVVGFRGGWLEREAEALGIGWQPLPPNPSAGEILGAIAHGLEAPPATASADGLAVLQGSFPAWLAEQLVADNLN